MFLFVWYLAWKPTAVRVVPAFASAVVGSINPTPHAALCTKTARVFGLTRDPAPMATNMDTATSKVPEADSSASAGSDTGSGPRPLEEPSDAAAPSSHISGVALALTIFALCIATLCVALDNTIIATAIPRISDEFRALQDIGWYGSGMCARVLHGPCPKQCCANSFFSTAYLLTTCCEFAMPMWWLRKRC